MTMTPQISQPIETRIRSITNLAKDINAFELVSQDGGSLPAFSAGAHIDVFLNDGIVRQYSLCSDPGKTHHYVFAVLREANGTGGSIALHDTLRAGQLLTISAPRNNFMMSSSAVRHLFLAGGIGITPIRAMIYRCLSEALDFELVYCTRSADRTAFYRDLVNEHACLIHHDEGNADKNFDLKTHLATPTPGTHLYYCGPPAFMRAVMRAAAHWPAGTCHFEYFKNDPGETAPDEFSAATVEDDPSEPGFQVKIKSTDAVFTVPPDRTIVEVLRDNGIEVETSCESGLCGTCRTRYLEGEPDHQDMILSDDERERDVLICCARSRSPLLVLDF